MLDTYKSSTHHPKKDLVFTAFMFARGSNEIGTSYAEKKFMGEDATKTSDDPLYGRPEYARVGPTRRRIRELRSSFLKGERENISMFPQKMYFGDRDRFICRDAAQSFADFSGIETETFDADHYKILNNSHALDDIQKRIETLKTADHLPRPRGSGTNFIDELLRFSTPSESSAGPLDPGAGFA